MADGSRNDSVAPEAVAELMFEVAQCFFRIRAFGLKEGFITDVGGAFGLIRSLALHGPLTVPQIARMRPVSRQRMQKLSDALADEGLVEFIDNPKHQRSKLVQLMPAGYDYYHQNMDRLLSLVAIFQLGSGEADIQRATQVVRCLGEGIGGMNYRGSATQVSRDCAEEMLA
jgi:DNA-binding MarR family transcriptional regulator